MRRTGGWGGSACEARLHSARAEFGRADRVWRRVVAVSGSSCAVDAGQSSGSVWVAACGSISESLAGASGKVGVESTDIVDAGRRRDNRSLSSDASTGRTRSSADLAAPPPAESEPRRGRLLNAHSGLGQARSLAHVRSNAGSRAGRCVPAIPVSTLAIHLRESRSNQSMAWLCSPGRGRPVNRCAASGAGRRHHEVRPGTLVSVALEFLSGAGTSPSVAGNRRNRKYPAMSTTTASIGVRLTAFPPASRSVVVVLSSDGSRIAPDSFL